MTIGMCRAPRRHHVDVTYCARHQHGMLARFVVVCLLLSAVSGTDSGGRAPASTLNVP
jgi:hypothetical protein